MTSEVGDTIVAPPRPRSGQPPAGSGPQAPLRRLRHHQQRSVRSRSPVQHRAILLLHCDVCFSNRPFEVKHFQTIRHCSVDVAHGLVLLFGIGTKGPSIMGFEDEAEQSFGRPCRQSNGRNQADIRTHLIHRPARDILPPVDLRLPPDALILGALHAAAVSLVQWNSVPSIQMRCRITANRRAKATIAFFIPRRLAICMAQALSQDHFFERSMLCAAS